jgi:hypothetical protein
VWTEFLRQADCRDNVITWKVIHMQQEELNMQKNCCQQWV